MLDVTVSSAYASALDVLHQYRVAAGGRSYKGRFVQLFLALKFYQSEIPSIHSGMFISTEVLQSFLDDLYAKTSKPIDSCVLSLFEANHLARTGVVPHAARTPSNIWRNNLNLQKGIGCYATPWELASWTFLSEDRKDCRHLMGTLNGGRCGLCPTGARYRNESHRKWLRIDPGGNGYAAVDLMNTANFSPYVAPAGARIPVVPLIVALYHDASPGLVLGSSSRQRVRVEDFCLDFNFFDFELVTYFDSNPANLHNRNFLRANPSLSYSPPGALTASGGVGTVAPTTRPGSRAAAGTPSIPAPVLGGTVTGPPRSHSGWDAEQYVFGALGGAGWTVHDVRRQKVGYDLLAKKGRRTIYVEVKSSVNLCVPSFTSREWQQAMRHGNDYIMAILENFNPLNTNTIYWVPDPASGLTPTTIASVAYSVSRSSWASAAVGLSRI